MYLGKYGIYRLIFRPNPMFDAVEYLPLSIVISTSKYDSAVALSVVFFNWSS